ncbi:MAG TPA: hypothetical protein VFR90_14895 [Methylibium sp.]|uniref:hypothetical protein n=1 Tax=Methylibium sp. TaxID=2067992 RepID=UPI002DBFE670|nr:hypothetical protein [Methylibium sp.]HEU4460406.1 hypothetical protein [Methylibium sp.]
MLKLIVVFVHLLAVCTALGAIIATDLRLLARLRERRLRLAPPNAYVMRLVGVSLAVLWASGALLLWLGHQEDPAYLSGNPKLIGKLMLVAVLTLNAAWLHLHTFRWLARARRVARWRFSETIAVAAPVAVSNSLWLYCAFLGIARPWNGVVPLGRVLEGGAVVFLLSFAAVLAVLIAVGRDTARAERRRAGRATTQPGAVGDWLHDRALGGRT